MPTPSFPARARVRHRARSAEQIRAARLVISGLTVGLGLAAAAVLSDVPIAALIVALLALTVAVVVADPDDQMMATVAPLPDVHTPPVATAPGLIRMVEVIAPPRAARARPYVDELLGTAEDVGVYRPRHACDTDTALIAQVRA